MSSTNILATINTYRKKLTKLITSQIGKSSKESNEIKNSNRDTIKRILISRPNHRLGNILLITPIVQEAINTFPNAKIDLFVKGNVALSIFQNYKEVDTIIRLPKQHFKNLGQYLFCWFQLIRLRYDVVINCEENSSSGKISTKLANGKYKYFGSKFIEDVLQISEEEKIHMAKITVYGFRNFLALSGATSNSNDIPKLNLMLSETEISEGKKIMDQIAKNKKKSIALFTNATGQKCYSKEWWTTFYELLVSNFKEYTIIEILPVENTSNIDFKAPTFYSKDIRQIGSVIANSAVFIGADSGMMHLASASQTTTIGLFSVTNTNRYTPYGNGSIAIDTNDSNFKDCINRIKNILSE
jgi:heptosyltransferase-3